MKIQWKLTILLLALSALVVLAAGYFSLRGTERYFHSRMVDELRVQAAVFESLAREYAMHDTAAYAYYQHLADVAGHRLTLIAADGTVVFESGLPRDELLRLENHLLRPEIQQALAGEYGTATRWSATLKLPMLYLAKRVAPLPLWGDSAHTVTIIRVSLPTTVADESIAEMRRIIVSASLFLFLGVATLSILLARRIARPVKMMNEIAAAIRAGNLDLRIPVTSNDELGRLAETLNSMLDRLRADITTLRKLERVRSEFLGNVSHELRTPIFAIQGMLETLLGGALNDAQVSRDFVERALKNTLRLNTLLGDLIEISRIESGEMKMSFRYFAIGEFLAGLVAEFSEQAAKKRIALTLRAARPEREVLGDRDRLKQVMINLIDNALKYSPPGAHVEVTTEDLADRCVLRVTDTGVGIAAEHLPRVFERFYRVDKERSREAGGTGLGLAIVKHIVEAHGHTVTVRSTPGEGSTFEFALTAS